MPTEPDSLSGEDTSLLLWFGRVLDHRLIMRTISMSSLIWKRIAFGFLLTACIFLGTGYATGLNMRSVSALFLLLTLPFQIALLTSLAKWIGLRHVDAAYHEIGSAITDDFLRGRNQSKRNLYAVLAGAEREQIFFLQGFLPAQLTKTEDKKERAQQVFEAIFRRLGRNSFLHTEPRKLAFVMGLHTLITAAG